MNEGDGTTGALRRIADALGVSPNAFLERGGGKRAANVEEFLQQSELVKLFADVKDPADRQDCLNFVRARTTCGSIATADHDRTPEPGCRTAHTNDGTPEL